MNVGLNDVVDVAVIELKEQLDGSVTEVNTDLVVTVGPVGAEARGTRTCGYSYRLHPNTGIRYWSARICVA